jgi:hypothetical protein
VLIEVNLTSNAVILGVGGAYHPFPYFLAAGVPATLSTDDEGVSRIDLTHEYQRAVETYGLSYAGVKRLVRAGLSYSFLAGESLWTGPGRAALHPACADDRPGTPEPSASCRALLAESEKAVLQWALEADLAAFERTLAEVVP